MAARSNFLVSQLVTEADVDQAFDDLENADHAQMVDLGFSGIMSGLVVSEHSPNNMTVDVTGGTSYDADGARTVVPSTQTVNLAVDHASVTTAVVTGGNSKVLSLFVKFARALSQPETDGTGTTVYYRRDESFSFYVKQGSEAVSPTPPSLEADGILLCDVTIAHGATTIVDGDISIARRQDLVVLTGTPLGTSGTGGRYGTYLEALQAIVTRYDNHVNAVADQHPASQINYAGGPTWANADNADKIGVTTVEAAIDAVATKLGATTTSHSGADLVGCAAMAGAYVTISGATLFQTLTALRSCANLEYAGGPVWANADNADKIAAQALEGALDSVATKLGATTASHSGLHLIGGATCGNFTAGTAYSFFSQLTAVTSSDDGAKRIGAQANGGLSSGTVRSQLDELDTEKAALAGAAFAGAVSAPSFAVSSTTVTRVVQSLMTNHDTGISSPNFVRIATGDRAYQVLSLPHGSTLNSVTVTVDPTGGSPLPTTRVSAYVIKRPVNSSSESLLGSVVDPNATIGAYQPIHTFTVTLGSPETIDNSANAYYVYVDGEAGSDTAEVWWYGSAVSQTVAAVDPTRA